MEAESNAQRVYDALLKDADLLLKLWIPIEEAAAEAGVTRLTDGDVAGVLSLMAERVPVLPNVYRQFPA